MTTPRVIEDKGHKILIFKDYLLWCHPGHTDGRPACGDETDHCERTVWFAKHRVERKNPLTIRGLCISCPPCGDHLYVVQDKIFPVWNKGHIDNAAWTAYYAASAAYIAELDAKKRAKV